MASPRTIEIVKATVPVLQQHGETITRHFYRKMFAEHPEVREFFNQAHQAAGTQPRALAGAVLAYAANIDRLEALRDALPVIVHKHAALGVLPEHYPIVGRCLLAAIREVLGETATDEIIDAWAEAYGDLAKLLIEAEERVYRDNAAREGGWRGPREFRVARRVRESDVITSFYLEPVDGGALLAFRPGQYVTLLLELGGTPVRRTYSLSDAPGQPYYRISVKREPGGLVSNHLHDEVREGATLRLLPPCGDFVLNEGSRPLVLVTGGVGITPALSMLNAVAATGRPVQFIHAARNGRTHAFRDHVKEIARRHPNVSTFFIYDEALPGDAPDAHGLLTAALLAERLPPDRNVDLYFLGPKPFMASVLRAARTLGIPAAQVRYEFFGPLQSLEDAA
jgi:nitric oxide dioxygenase